MADADKAVSIKPAFQPSVNFDFGNGISTNILTSLYLADRDNLKNLDELDLTLAFKRDTSVGTLGGGIIGYFLPRPSYTNAEIYIRYSLPFLLSPTLTCFGNISEKVLNQHIQYNSLSFSHDFKLTKKQTLSPGLSGGLLTPSGVENVIFNDISLSINYGLSLGNWGINVNANSSFLPEAEEPVSNIVLWFGVGASYVIKGIRK